MPVNASVEAALRELAARGLIAETPAPTLLTGGNRDRRPDGPVITYRAQSPAGQVLKVSVGQGLVERGAAQAEFARACPNLVASPLFTLQVADTEALGEPFIEGESLEATAGNGDRLRVGFAGVCAALANTEAPSNEALRKQEWQNWADSLLDVPAWTPGERRHFAELVLPRLYAALATTPPSTRWSNGDFHSANLITSRANGFRLVDFEHLGRTHFFGEDAVRFHVLSAVARAHPDWFTSGLPLPGPAWHLYFWLRQLGLEVRHNRADYLALVRPKRLGVIRRLAEATLDVHLSGWSVEPAPVLFHLEESLWRNTPEAAVLVSGWCHVPSAEAVRAIVAYQGERVTAETAPDKRTDVQEHFSGNVRALLSGFRLETNVTDPSSRLQLCAFTDDGTLLPFHSLDLQDLPGRGPSLQGYGDWVNKREEAAVVGGEPVAPSEAGPLFSILLPTFNTPPAFLEACLGSVHSQVYPRWELCVVDDASTVPETLELLRRAAAKDARIRLRVRNQNGGIARATNDALQEAKGDFIVLLDHDDAFHPNALWELSKALQGHPELDALYSDEDKISAEGSPVLPFFKPGFSPEFLLGVMYAGHVLCVRTAVARAAGGFDPMFDGVQDYEFFLRVTERTGRIAHLPQVLYHWRQSPSSSSLHGNVKGDMDSKQAAAVAAHLQRLGRAARITPLRGHRLRIVDLEVPPFEFHRIRNKASLMEAMVGAARTSMAKVLVFHSIELPGGSTNGWSTLAALAMRADSGCIAPLLLAQDGRVLESGCTLDCGRPVSLMRGFDPDGDGYNGTLKCTREVAVFSPLLFAVRREHILRHQAGTWGEFSRNLRSVGLQHRVCPVARIATPYVWRNWEPDWPAAGLEDPFYPVHCDPRSGDYRLCQPGPARG